METIHFDNWRSLEHFGINMLTGEGCAHALRLLCDVNSEGRDILLDYLGLPHDTKLAEAWNKGTKINGELPVGSVMLHRASMLQLAEFAMLRQGVKAIVYKGEHAVMGIFTDDMLKKYRELIKDWPETTAQWKWQIRIIGKSSQPSVGSRNVHAFTGRVE